MEEINALSEQYRRAIQARVLGFDEEDALDTVQRDVTRRLGEIIRDARRALREVAALREHRCEWSEDEYCLYCGADGRA